MGATHFVRASRAPAHGTSLRAARGAECRGDDAWGKLASAEHTGTGSSAGGIGMASCGPSAAERGASSQVACGAELRGSGTWGEFTWAERTGVGWAQAERGRWRGCRVWAEREEEGGDRD